MLIQIHILQNYAPANLNRDDTGSPKDAIFGGKRRGRISSQCLKRSIRRSEAFTNAFAETDLLGIRTKSLPLQIEKVLKQMDLSESEIDAIVCRVSEIGRESKKEKDNGENENEDESQATVEKENKQLIFLGQDEIPVLAEKLLKIYREKGEKDWKKAKIQDITAKLGESVPRSVDIAMFGRMTTSSAFEDVQASVQVAHAISTNALAPEFDYFTAVDDLSGETGAGMIGDVEFNSSTYYKYINVFWDGLVCNLGGDISVARQAVLALLEAALTAQPSGKQNSFAAFNLPDFAMVEVTDRNLPVSYANAFLKPIQANAEKSLMDVSIQKLGDYVQQVSQAYVLNGRRAYFAIGNDNSIPNVEHLVSSAELSVWLSNLLPAEGS